MDFLTTDPRTILYKKRKNGVKISNHIKSQIILKANAKHLYRLQTGILIVLINVYLWHNIFCVQTENINIFLDSWWTKQLIVSTKLFLLRSWKLTNHFLLLLFFFLSLLKSNINGKFWENISRLTGVFEFFLNIITICFFIEQ